MDDEVAEGESPMLAMGQADALVSKDASIKAMERALAAAGAAAAQPKNKALDSIRKPLDDYSGVEIDNEPGAEFY